MGQGCEIAARPYRSASRDYWKDAVIQETAEQISYRRPDAGQAPSQTMRPQQEQPARLLRAQRLADAAGVTAHEIQLQLASLLRRDALRRKAADAGRHAVDDLLFLDHFLDQSARPLHGVARARTEQMIEEKKIVYGVTTGV